MRRTLLPILALAIAAPALVAVPAVSKPASSKINAELAAAVANPLRDKDRARYIYRKPAETLTFFQITPDMKVGEYAPGGEWYSRLLGLY
nr:methyltransferase [Novosphingobium sp.]